MLSKSLLHDMYNLPLKRDDWRSVGLLTLLMQSNELSPQILTY